MSISRHLSGLVLATSLIVAACTSGAGSPATSAPAGGTGAVTIGATSSGNLGTFLAGPDGRTLYTHAGDSVNTSTCSGGCLTAWPPLTVATGQQPTAGPGVTGVLATFARPDGSMWVTYNGLPLYYWQGDAKAGDVTGQGINGFSVAQVSGGAAASGAVGTAAPNATPAPTYKY